MIDLIGYIASVFIIISFLVNEITLLRILSIGGGMWFIVYGGLVHSNPIIIQNLILITINLYKLISEYREKKK
jgi:hypothetical protein